MKQRPRIKNTYDGYNNHSYSNMSNGKYSDDSGDEIDLPVRRAFKPQQFIEAQVQDGDTLQAIALRFNCSVSKLMRVNNILRENEIFAKRVLKIPVAAFSLLTESLPLVHTSGTNSPTKSEEVRIANEAQSEVSVKENELQQKLIIASVNASEYQGSKYSQSTIIENLQSNDISKPAVNSAASSSNSFIQHEANGFDDSFQEQLDLSAPLLGNVTNSPSVEAVVINEFTSQGADWGIKWIHLLIVILVLGVFIPLVYVLYVAEHPEMYHHHHS